MTIAISTTPDNAIANLTDLVAEIRDELDDSAYSLDKIYRAIARAEAVFNREIRAPRMETQYEFTTSDEITDLPGDFLQLRAVYMEGSPDRPILSLSPASLRSLYAGRSGTPAAYAIENRAFMIGPVGEATFKMVYYASIPSLTVDNPSNWLLTDHPDLYVHQVLAILFNKTSDREAASLNLSIAQNIMESINAATKKARWGASPLVPMGIQQVSGARI